MFVSGFNINLQVAVSIQMYKELHNRASNDSREKYTVQIYQLECCYYFISSLCSGYIPCALIATCFS